MRKRHSYRSDGNGRRDGHSKRVRRWHGLWYDRNVDNGRSSYGRGNGVYRYVRNRLFERSHLRRLEPCERDGSLSDGYVGAFRQREHDDHVYVQNGNDGAGYVNDLRMDVFREGLTNGEREREYESILLVQLLVQLLTDRCCKNKKSW